MIDVQKYLKEHIPYSIKILMTLRKLSSNTYYGDPDILNAAFVGSIVKGRMLLEVLGISLRKNGKELYNRERNPNGDDLTAEDFGGKLVKVEDLNKEKYETIKQFLVAVNKYEAHLTEQNVGRDLKKVKSGYELIFQLVKENVYTPNGKQLEI